MIINTRAMTPDKAPATLLEWAELSGGIVASWPTLCLERPQRTCWLSDKNGVMKPGLIGARNWQTMACEQSMAIRRWFKWSDGAMHGSADDLDDLAVVMAASGATPGFHTPESGIMPHRQ